MSAAPWAPPLSPLAAEKPSRKFLSLLLLAAASLLALLSASIASARASAIDIISPDLLSASLTVLLPAGHSKTKSLSMTLTVVADGGINPVKGKRRAVLSEMVLMGPSGVSVVGGAPSCTLIVK